jgi:hypothetical protein
MTSLHQRVSAPDLTGPAIAMREIGVETKSREPWPARGFTTQSSIGRIALTTYYRQSPLRAEVPGTPVTAAEKTTGQFTVNRGKPLFATSSRFPGNELVVDLAFTAANVSLRRAARPGPNCMSTKMVDTLSNRRESTLLG